MNTIRFGFGFGMVVVVLLGVLGSGLCAKTGDVSLPLSDYVELIKEQWKFQNQNQTVPPKVVSVPSSFTSNFAILNSKLTGSTVKDFMELKHSLKIKIFQSKWTLTSLCSAETLVSEIGIQDAQGNPVGLDVAFTTILNGDLSLVIQQEGLYNVTFTIYTPIQTSRNIKTISYTARHPFSMFDLGFAGQPHDLKISPLSVYTQDYYENSTFVSAKCPSTTFLDISWRDEEHKVHPTTTEKPKETYMTAIQHVLHSIGDVSVQSTNIIDYTINHNEVALEDLSLSIQGENVRVVRVTGLYIEKWEESKQANGDTWLNIKLKHSVPYDTYQLVVVTEQHVGEATNITTPNVKCLGALSQQGVLGIVKATNVEIHERETTGVAKADQLELSDNIRSQTNKPILLAYSFLHPDYSIKLQKTHHIRLNVLDTSIEHAHVQILVSEEYALHKITCSIKNSNRQYLRVKFAQNITAIWSTYLNSEPVNPVIEKSAGNHNLVLIPLTNAMHSGMEESSTLELVYLTQHFKLESIEEMKVTIPSLDVPITLLTTEIRFPPHSTPSKVIASAGMKQVQSFSSSTPKAAKKLKSKVVVPQGYGYLKSQFVLEDDEGNIANVQVNVPQFGVPYRFEKLLVLDTKQEMIFHFSTSYGMDILYNSWNYILWLFLLMAIWYLYR